MTISFRHILTSFIVLTVLIAVGCSTSQKAMEDETGVDPSDTETVADEDLDALQTMLAQNRSKLSDVHTSQKHDMPEVFLQKDSSDASLNSDPFDGYRVQILSTRDQPLADSVANKFRTWADSTIEGYTAEAYIFFKQPFYKVHIGDFQEREQANSFSKLIKRKYPDAWVVHDRIDPANVPADTSSFSYSKPRKLD